MNDWSDRITKLSPKRLAFLAMELQSQVEALQRAQTEPIAVVGLGCRFPGDATDPDAFWDMLRRGKAAIGEVPADRWDREAFYDPDPDAPGKMYTKRGAFLREIDRFDPQFFGISPREAIGLDPQQRLLLEVTWEALEAGGLVPDKLLGTRTGVFVGISSADYMRMQWSPAEFDIYSGTGNALSVAAGRLAYTLGLQGPCIAVDTACSSSLVAVHLACQSLRSGECAVALAGGVNVIISPDTNVILSRGRMLAPDGRCKTFDAAADGYVRGEGCGMVVLKRLADAVAAGDRILALIRGSATNQDGRSSGLTAPNGPAQEAVVRDALKGAGVEPHEIDYVEAHGTGTSLGDPIEVQALGSVLGSGRPSSNPVLIGSVKTNIGHLEAAAGVAGLIKVILALQKSEIPPHIGFRTPNPHIPWSSLPVRVASEAAPWARGSRKRIAGVSSFGFSGSNAHVIVEEAPPQAEPETAAGDRPQHVLALSARTSQSLRLLAERYAKLLENGGPGLAVADVCSSANGGRAHFEHRLAAVGSSAASMAAQLLAFAGEAPDSGVLTGRTDSGAVADVAFLFTGQGSQYDGMARDLYETQPAFRAALDRCAEALRAELPVPLLDVLYGTDAALLDQTLYTQPALFAIEYALAELWRSWGVRPAAMLGHSVGEYVAACVAGVFTVEEALRLVAARARLMQALPAGGGMAAVFAPRDQVTAALAQWPSLSIAAVNGPSEIVISGALQAIESACAWLVQQGVRCEPLRVSHAFHSALLDPMLEDFRRIADQVAYKIPQIDIVSNVTGDVARDDEVSSAEYWCRHARQAVLFAPGLETLRGLGITRFLEIGPSATLCALGRRTLAEESLAWLPSLRKGRSDSQQLLETLGGLYVRGVRIDWEGFDRGFVRRKVALPTYPFRRERYWIETSPHRGNVAAGADGANHPLLGRQLLSPALPDGDTVFEADLGSREAAYLSDHKVSGGVLAPAAIFVEMALAAHTRAREADEVPVVSDLVIESGLFLREGADQRVQVILENGATPAFRILSSAAEEGRMDRTWVRHASGRLGAAASVPSTTAVSSDDVKSRCVELSGDDYYQRLRAGGLDMGPRFRAIAALWRRDGEALGEIRLPDALARGDDRYFIHPVLFDACCHVAGASLPNPNEDTYLVVGCRRVEIFDRPAMAATAHALVRAGAEPGAPAIDVDVTVLDAAGRTIARLEQVSYKRATRQAMERGSTPLSDWLYRVDWQPKPRRDQERLPDLVPPHVVAEAVKADAAVLLSDPEIAAMPETLPPLEALATAYAVRALTRLGWKPIAGQTISAAKLADELRIVPAHRRLLGRILEFLAEDGFLRRSRGDFEVVHVPAASEPQTCDGEAPSADATLTLVQRCGSELAGVLAGRVDPLQLLFPSGSFDVLQKIYRDSSSARGFSGLVARTVTAAMHGTGTRPVRILEIGAGTGGTTSALLPAVPADRTEYLFTDVSPLFLAKAREQFGSTPNIDFRVLDIEKDPKAQGLPAAHFDVIVAANVIHATRNLRETLAHVRQLAAPGALFLMVEATRPARWVDITFGLTDGWWRFEDADLRPSHPLVSRRAWLDLLADAGFEDAFALPGDLADDDLRAAQFVIGAAVPKRAADAVHRDGRWLILGDRGDVGRQLADLLGTAGYDALLVNTRERRPDLRALVREWSTRGGAPVQGIVNLCALDATPSAAAGVREIEDDQLWSCGTTLDVLQALLEAGADAPIWIATQQAQPVARDGAGEALSVSQSSVWGIGRVIGLEHPTLFGGLVDVDAADPAAAASALFAELSDPDGEDQVAWRGGARYAARIVRASGLAAAGPALRHDASYIVTGGIGGLGLKVAAWLAEGGARHLVLTGRRGLPPRSEWAALRSDSDAGRQAAAVEAIERTGATVHVAAVDVADADATAALLAKFGTEYPPLRGIVHAAAALSSASLRDLTMDHLRAMLRPKTLGTWILHQQTAARDLDFFVSFSSTTSLLGSKDLGHYAAANCFLDTFAHYRRRAGLPATTINWGTWDLMKVTADQDREIRQGGLKPMASARALAALGDLLDCAEPQVTVANVDWHTLKAVYEARRQRPFLEHVASRAPRRRGGSEAGGTIVQRLSSLRPEDRRDTLMEHVRTTAAAVLGLPLADVDEGRGLFDMGMDSLMSVELKGRLERSVGTPLPSTLTFNCPTVAALTDYLAGELGDLFRAAPPAADAEEAPAVQDEDIEDLSEDELTSLLAEKLGQMT